MDKREKLKNIYIFINECDGVDMYKERDAQNSKRRAAGGDKMFLRVKVAVSQSWKTTEAEKDVLYVCTSRQITRINKSSRKMRKVRMHKNMTRGETQRTPHRSCAINHIHHRGNKKGQTDQKNRYVVMKMRSAMITTTCNGTPSACKAPSS